ncbi:TolB family protein [Haoranjiania flava]|uniref:Uncharacterized protein n=1 Tax=Haoranjiania flava TaxID=1856322 RepID=A0AAE3LKS3_9BACT|nr:hypothetical protein [Haoranjiania flava]MCU7694888.1 hypothetical protein [Haoranjiania flava]
MRNYMLFICLMLAQLVHAQRFGAVPARKEWKQIDTGIVRVIFPGQHDSLAARIATIANYQQSISKNFGHAGQKISMILHDEVINSNGYVALGPFRSELYLAPPVDVFSLGALPWEQTLTVHEYRHVQQYNYFNTGLARAMSLLFGENGRALANAISIPDWFFEGDAVYAETRLSTQGRGRIPAFHNRFKSLYYGGKRYSYMKLRNGSYKDYVPDHYALGYLLVAYGYEKYGEDFWQNVTRHAAAFDPLLYPLQKNIEKYAGVKFTRFVQDAFDFYQQQWKVDNSDSAVFETSVAPKNVVSYKYPYPANEGGIVFLKESYRTAPAFYLRRNGIDKKIAAKHLPVDDYFSYNNGRIIYASYTPDKRWGSREYSDITLLDIASQKQRKITGKKRYYTPDISADGKNIVAAELSSAQYGTLVLLDGEGELIKKLQANRHHIFTYPKFINNSTIAAIERNKKGGMRLVQIDVDTDKLEPLTPFANTLIGNPVASGDTLYYSRSSAQYDEAMAYVFSQKQTYKLATYHTGIYQSFVNNKNLTASVFTAEGYRLATFAPKWQKVYDASADTLRLLYNQPHSNVVSAMLSKVADTAHAYTIKDYKASGGLVNFHSMQPYFTDPDYTLTFLSSNLLNTFLAELSYTFNRVERFHRASLYAIYGGWYLQPFLSASGTYKREMMLQLKDSSYHPLNWNEANVGAGLQLPLNFSVGNMYRYLTLSSSVNNNHVFYTRTPGEGLYQNKNIIYFSGRIAYTQQVQKGLQQIYPAYAQAFSVNFRKAILSFNAYQMTAAASLYFPGLSASHSFMVAGAAQRSDTLRNYTFSNTFPFSRGYPAFHYPGMVKYGLNYHFPIAYPELGFGNIAYLKRLRNNLFFDHTLAFNKDNVQQNFASVGTELFFDTNWWNQLPVSFGVRFSYLLHHFSNNKNHYRWEIILPVNLYN